MLAHWYTLLRNIMQLLMYGGGLGGNMIVMEYTQAGKMLHCLHTSIRSGSADRQQRHTLSGMLRKSRGWINTSQTFCMNNIYTFFIFQDTFFMYIKNGNNRESAFQGNQILSMFFVVQWPLNKNVARTNPKNLLYKHGLSLFIPIHD